MPLHRRDFLAAGATAGAWLALGCARHRRVHAADVRELAEVVPARQAREGAGVIVHRSLGGRQRSFVDPFLLLDEIKSANPAEFERGFPTHPHRGFETVSILLEGAFAHADSMGNRGLITGGGAQWMTAGRGIVHSEMPEAPPGTRLWGLQLWVNLPAAQKMTRPRYQDLGPAEVVEVDLGDARARVIAGAAGGRRGPVDGIVVAPTLIDVTLPAGGELRLAVPPAHQTLLYALDGALTVGQRGAALAAQGLGVLGPGPELLVRAAPGSTPARLLVIAAAPIGEPVARRGPFVMNSEAELDQAVADYRSGRLVEP